MRVTEAGSERELISEALVTRAAERFAVFGQVVRLRLIERLAIEPATPQEMADELGLSQQNVSKHLQVLFRAGLVRRRADGSSVVYTLDDPSAVELLADVVDGVHERLRRMAATAVDCGVGAGHRGPR